jgi:hypothetical protein
VFNTEAKNPGPGGGCEKRRVVKAVGQKNPQNCSEIGNKIDQKRRKNKQRKKEGRKVTQ